MAHTAAASGPFNWLQLESDHAFSNFGIGSGYYQLATADDSFAINVSHASQMLVLTCTKRLTGGVLETTLSMLGEGVYVVAAQIPDC